MQAKTYNINSIDDLSRYVAKLVGDISGNILGEDQHNMVKNRLEKRLLDLDNISPRSYANYLQQNKTTEVEVLISLLTTHHTFFFREFSHFEYLKKNLLTFVNQAKKRGDNKITIYSAACSMGQEVYSLACFFEKHLQEYPGVSYEILGSDIDTESVKIAANGVYKYSEVKSIPQIYISDNWQRGTGDIEKYVRVKKHIKQKCTFKTLNLLNLSEIKNKKFDIIFCRNVFIYFEKKDIEIITESFKNLLTEDGILVTGLSESLKSLNIFKTSLAPSVYSFKKTVKVAPLTSLKKVQAIKAPTIKEPIKREVQKKPIRVLNVDDSKSVLMLLKKIFTSDADFELVGQAKNGKEAEEFLKTNSVDVMTLDIHMPTMDGVEYLKKNHNPKHPKVIVVSSASREDTRYAQKMLENGAVDFVEKPALNNLKEKADEIKMKLKMALESDNNNNTTSSKTELDRNFQINFKIDNCSSKSRIIIANYANKHKVTSILKELREEQPPVFVFYDAQGAVLEMIVKNLNNLKYDCHVYTNIVTPKANNIYICNLDDDIRKVTNYFANKPTSISILRTCSDAELSLLKKFNNTQVLVEDSRQINENTKKIANDLFPLTSMAHVATEHLSKRR